MWQRARDETIHTAATRYNRLAYIFLLSDYDNSDRWVVVSIEKCVAP